MATLTEGDVHKLTDTVEQIAGRIARRYDTVAKEDIAQEIWVWALEHVDYVHRFVAAPDQSVLTKSLYHAGLRYAEKEWKAGLPYDWRDQYEYTRPEVARLLPLALDESLIPGLSGGGLHDGPSHKADPALGGGLLASLIDVRVAYSKLSDSDQAYLADVVGLDHDWVRISSMYGLQENSAYAKYMRILDRMVTRHLGRPRE
jgi:hypothetical protein